MEDKTGGPAYPAVITDSEGQVVNSTSGMTLRDYFAGQCIIGFMISTGWEALNTFDKQSESAYRYANAMIKERKKVVYK